ncbi:MAG: peptidase T [Helcococcus sp.]|nr:peptidase T [Helcococcus sp.]
MNILERFKKYVAFDTQSDHTSDTVPSTLKQLKLGEEIVSDLKEIGLENAFLDKHGYVYATLKANSDKSFPTIGFIAHMDTSPDMSGKNVKPIIHEYKGGDIELNDDFSIKVSEFPFLKDLEGLTIITASGDTLLGADDKSGIVEILDAMEYLINHPEIEHGDIKIAITVDEEIGRGADYFDVDGFNADFAYTMDGGAIGELEYENFNGASALVKIQGKNVHPGSAKNTMINSIRIAMEFDSMLPVDQKPEYTVDYEGFNHLNDIKGNVEYTEMEYIIRDHDFKKFEEKKQLFKDITEFLNKKYNNIITLEINDSYYNMREKIEPRFEIVELAKKSMEDIGITPDIKAIRGGTDGASLSYKGLLTPNIFAGGLNFHGRYELVPLEWMQKASELIIKIVENSKDFE